MEDSNRKLQEMADRLEKSEAGRKKLRQAITLLKEKLEATEKVLEVNDTLRQECEKERLRAEREKKKAEEEKALRIQIENENTSTKEQLAIVLQRLDALERNSKVDRAETLRVRGEMKHALSALSGAVQLAEAAHSSIQGLEKFVQDKVVDSVSTSTRALALAQSVTSDIKAAQATAASAEKNSQSLSSRLALVQKQNAGYEQRINLLQQETTKACSLAQNASSDAKAAQVAAASAEKLSQSFASRVAATHKQYAGLDQRVNHLQQELRTRFMDTGSNFDGAKTGKAAVPRGEKKAASKGMVLSKSQQLSEGTPKLPAPIQIVDSGSSSGCMSSLSRDIDSSGQNRGNNPTRVPSVSAIATRDSLASTPTSAVGTNSRKFAKPPVSFNVNIQSAEALRGQENMQRILKRRVSVDSTNGSVPGEPDGSLKKKDAGMPQISPPTGGKLLALKNTAPGPTNLGFFGRQNTCGDGNPGEKIQCLPLKVAEPERGLHGGEDKVVKGQRKELLPAALLKDITKLFSKEKRVKSKLEAKFTALEQLLRSGEEGGRPVELASAQEGKKRKCRDNVPGRIIGDCKRSKKNSKLDLAPDCRAKHAVESRSFSLGSKVHAIKTKDGVLGDSSVNVQLTPQSTLPVVEKTATPADECTKLQSQKKAGRDIISFDSKAESCVSDLSDRDKCQGVQQVPEGMEGNKENVCVVAFSPEVIIDDSGACSPSLPRRTKTSANDSVVEDMDVDMATENPVLEETRSGWDTGSDMSDDEFDLEWWETKRVLLSPTLPPLRHSSELIEDRTLDVDLASAGSKEISLEDIARFLEVLPPIRGELCESETEDCGGKENGEAMLTIDNGSTAVSDQRGPGDTEKLEFSGTLSLSVENSKLENSEAVAKEEKRNIHESISASRSQVHLAGLRDNDEMLQSEKTNIVSLPGSFADSRKCVNCGPGEDLGNQSSKLTLCEDSSEQIHGIYDSLRKEPGGNADGDAAGDRECVGVVCMVSSDITKADSADNAGGYADMRKFIMTNREELGIALESEILLARTEDVCRRVSSEGEAKDDSVFGLKLLEGILCNDESIRSREVVTDKGPLRDIREIAAVVTKTRNRLAEALEDACASDVKCCRAASEVASCFEESRLSALELVCVFTASLIDVFGVQEVETLERPPNQCSFLHHLLVLTNEVFKTEGFRRTFPSGLQGEVVFRNQLLEFLISGILRPFGRLGVEDDSHGREALTFRILQDASDSEKIRIVTSAGELLAFLCIGAGNQDFLRISIYLILRYCNMDSWWLLSAISSFARVCGRQLLASGPGDISGRAVTVVISELLKDAEGSDDLGKEDVPTVSSSRGLEVVSQELQGKYSEDRNRVEKVVVTTDSFSSTLQSLRSSVGKFEDSLNFEAFLPEMFQAFFRVASPDVSEILSGPEDSSSGAACTGGSSCIVEDHSAEGAGAAVVSKVEGPASQISGKIKAEDIDRYCWQCSYSKYNFQGFHFQGSTCILKQSDSIIARRLKFHEITHALEVVAFHLGWEWTYNDLLVEHLSKRVFPGAPEMAVSCVAESLGILGRLGIEADGTELAGVREVRGILLAILESGVRETGQDGGIGSFSFLTQVAAAESLLNLCRGVRKVRDSDLTGLKGTSCSILAWFQALDPAVVMSLPSSMRNAISSFAV